MKKRSLSLAAALFLLLTACGMGTGDARPDPAPALVPALPAIEIPTTPSPVYEGPFNPLTGLPIDEKWENARPVAVMLNNLKQAMPQHGVAQADIIYEALAEGGITRMLGVYQSVEGVDMIGSVRSARTYYLELALGHDAVFLHAGGSPDAYDKIKAWNVTALDCVNGPYEGSLYWRDKDRARNNGWVHSVVTSGEKILELFPTYSFRQEHEDGYRYEMAFAQDAAPADGQQALRIEVPFSNYKTGVFVYDGETGKYLVEEYGSAYIDGNTGEQVGVTNVLILQTSCRAIPGDEEGRMDVELSGGDGWFACGGKIVPIRWSKDGINGQLVYRTQSGKLLTLGEGNSYVNIIPLTNEIAVE